MSSHGFAQFRKQFPYFETNARNFQFANATSFIKFLWAEWLVWFCLTLRLLCLRLFVVTHTFVPAGICNGCCFFMFHLNHFIPLVSCTARVTANMRYCELFALSDNIMMNWGWVRV